MQILKPIFLVLITALFIGCSNTQVNKTVNMDSVKTAVKKR